MRLLLSTFALAAGLGSAQSATPAPLNGIWTLTHVTPQVKPDLSLAPVQLVIVGGQLRGSIGCGTYAGTIRAARNRLTIQVAPLPPRPNERCLYAQPLAFHAALNASTGYLISGNTRQLVLFSKTTRLTFERIGYVTPAKP
ncbi:META domain-containing protein [Deinococcus sp. QL22]|uniref:META domain-containing protein n=1 Tax=Deinococcus sp. QL22 TaxID=2939437 RepID=UPI0020174314|nr:META domain-containing protein [Deinococcus sp. QL22]UQN06741.1 META domain-containing protein [Deinococcus sp. QL22]